MRWRRSPPESLDGDAAARDADAAELLEAARRLVARGVLAREADPRCVDVWIAGRGFRYLVRFWTEVDVLGEAESGWHLRLDGPAEAARARRRVAEEWARAGAPDEWARAEADSAVDELLLLRLGTAWGTA